MSEFLHILAIVAHRDDAEILMGGTLAAAAEEGKRVGVLDLTKGETGTRGDTATRAREAEEAAAILGLSVRENIGLPDGGIEVNVANRLKIAERIRVHAPDIILTHFPGGRNPDHRAASILAEEAAYSAGLARFGGGGRPHRPRRIFHSVSFLNRTPSIVVDITSSFEKKMRAVRAYVSQFEGAMEAGDILSNNRDDIFERIALCNRANGALIQAPYGEPYRTALPIPVRDILSITGRTL